MQNEHTWQPSATINNLKKRAVLLAQIREFFAAKSVTEVETPALACSPVTDPHLSNFHTQWFAPDRLAETQLYLQTSPEYAMKRLLCAGSGCIYQMCKAFRNEENGRFHNPEFTILEWYRIDFNHWQLMAEVEELLVTLLKCPKAVKTSYQQAFISTLNIDPLTIDLAELKTLCTELGYGEIAASESNRDTLLQLLFCEKVEVSFDPNIPQFIFDFPASQAALARLSMNDSRVAERFEVYYRGIELANGFHELSDPVEQQQRFEQDNLLREAMNLSPAKIDSHLLGALKHGLPNCAGVALGIDRLIMIALQADHIKEVVSFTTSNA